MKRMMLILFMFFFSSVIFAQITPDPEEKECRPYVNIVNLQFGPGWVEFAFTWGGVNCDQGYDLSYEVTYTMVEGGLEWIYWYGDWEFDQGESGTYSFPYPCYSIGIYAYIECLGCGRYDGTSVTILMGGEFTQKFPLNNDVFPLSSVL